MDHTSIHNSPSEFMPPGYRFRPTDGELIEYYLQNKLRNTLLYNKPFLDVDLYASNPNDLIAMHGDLEKDQKSWYFFTPRLRKYRNGTRPNRSTGKGYWKASGTDSPIDMNGVLVGYKKVLNFFLGGSNPTDIHRTEWKMHEYVTKDHFNLPSTSQNPMQLNDCVLCKIYKNQRSPKRKKDRLRDDDSNKLEDTGKMIKSAYNPDAGQNMGAGQNIDRRIEELTTDNSVFYPIWEYNRSFWEPGDE